MSQYTPVTNFLAKDSLVSGNPLKLIKGADLTTEFAAVQTALNSKFDGVAQFAPDGSAATPAFGFSSTAGVGMFNNAGVLGFASAGAARVTINAAGNVVLNVPVSGIPLTAVGLDNGYIASFQAPGTNGGTIQLFDTTGALVRAYIGFGQSTGGTAISDFVIAPGTAGSTKIKGPNLAGTPIATFTAGVQLGAPTGGDQGAGTLNATGLFVNGVNSVQTGMFTGTLTGCTTSPNTTFGYSIVNGTLANIYCTSGGFIATSNATTCTITGLPSVLNPVGSTFAVVGVQDSGTFQVGMAQVASNTISLSKGINSAPGGFTATGGKGIPNGFSFTYALK